MQIAVIIGTTRAERVTPRVARWVEKKAAEFGLNAEVRVLDLKDYTIPMLEEAPWTPNRTLTSGTQQWLDDLEAADAYVVVTAEYNHGIPAVLKNALDYTNGQMRRKPAAIISHGVNHGVRANEILRLVLNSTLGVVTVPTAGTFFGQPSIALDEDGVAVEDNSLNNEKLRATLEELVWYATALQGARLVHA